MNEFIVWDKAIPKTQLEAENDEPSGCFVDNFEYIKSSSYLLDALNGNIPSFNYIGKTDIDGKKIYANCSIVEWIEYESYGGTKIHNQHGVKVIGRKQREVTKRGIFTFNNDESCYEIRTKDNIFFNRGGYQQNLKVIGTLQEDKHLLGENND